MGLATDEDGLWAMEVHLEGEVERMVNELNLVRKEILAMGDCHACKGEKNGGGKKVKCGLCGTVWHASCVGTTVKKGYFYCDQCTPQLDDNDPAQNLKLMQFVTS